MQKRGRVYQIGRRFIEINFDVLDMLEQWNEQNDASSDFTFALTVLLSVLSLDNISTGEFANEAMGFLIGEFVIFFLIILQNS